MKKLYQMKFILVLLTGCALFPASEKEVETHLEFQVKKLAEFDMSCSQKDLKVKSLGVRTYGVTGCNQKSSYIADCPLEEKYYGRYKKCQILKNTSKNAMIVKKKQKRRREVAAKKERQRQSEMMRKQSQGWSSVPTNSNGGW